VSVNVGRACFGSFRTRKYGDLISLVLSDIWLEILSLLLTAKRRAYMAQVFQPQDLTYEIEGLKLVQESVLLSKV